MGVMILEELQLKHSLSRRCLVGRSSLAHLRITDSEVSSEHAVIYFDQTAWKVRDLGSRNGTFVNGRRLGIGESFLIATEDRIAFGGTRLVSTWTLLSESGPGPAAIGAGLRLLEGAESSLWLPDADSAELCVTATEGGWMAVGPNGARPVRHGDRVEVAGAPWELCLPARGPADSMELGTTRNCSVQSAEHLEFSVSRDGEHIGLAWVSGTHRANLGGRAFNRALLELARRRLADETAGVTEGELGWTYADELQATLALDREIMNLHLWRAVQSLARVGLSGERLVERRRDTHQLRLGFSCRILEP